MCPQQGVLVYQGLLRNSVNFQINTKVKKILAGILVWNISRSKRVKPLLVNPGNKICQRELCNKSLLLLGAIVWQKRL